MISLPNLKETVDYSNLTTENYKQLLNETVVSKIEYYLEENFYIDDMIDFINEYNEIAFCEHYDEYVDAGEEYSYEAVDAFIEEFVNDCYSVDIPAFIAIDWEESFDNLDFIYNNGFVFDSQF